MLGVSKLKYEYTPDGKKKKKKKYKKRKRQKEERTSVPRPL
jgi:hypothetical protein